MTEETATMADANETMRIVAEIGPILHGKGPAIQAAVLADLVATWLAGFAFSSDVERLREELLTAHIEQVRMLIPINEKMMLDRYMGKTEGPTQ